MVNVALDPTNPDTWPVFLLVADVASILHIHPKTVYQLIDEKKLKAKKAGRQWRVKKADLLNY